MEENENGPKQNKTEIINTNMKEGNNFSASGKIITANNENILVKLNDTRCNSSNFSGIINIANIRDSKKYRKCNKKLLFIIIIVIIFIVVIAAVIVTIIIIKKNRGNKNKNDGRNNRNNDDNGHKKNNEEESNTIINTTTSTIPYSAVNPTPLPIIPNTKDIIIPLSTNNPYEIIISTYPQEITHITPSNSIVQNHQEQNFPLIL